MPYCDVLDVRVLGPDLGDHILETIGESLGLSCKMSRLWYSSQLGDHRIKRTFKVVPTILELALATIIYVLPVVVYDQACYLDIMLGQLIDRIEDFLVRESLAKRVPGTEP